MRTLVFISASPGCWKAQVGDLELSGSEPGATRNKSELAAVVAALTSLNGKKSAVTVFASRYIQKGLTQWIPRWTKVDWKTPTKGKPSKYKELWQQFNWLCHHHQDVEWRWRK